MIIRWDGFDSRCGCFAIFCIITIFFPFSDFVYGAEGQNVALSIDVSSPKAVFMPDMVFGAGLDGIETDMYKKIYTPGNIEAMSRTPYRRLAYRLRTELGIQSWHWNETGSWSDAENQQGYWISSDKAAGPLLRSYGYCLPRRGSTLDQADNDGYSRLDDGDEMTFWKSNPYLDAYFTGEDNALYPQWVVIDLGKKYKINALHIVWGEPYATRYQVEYWDGEDEDYPNYLEQGVWRTFSGGDVRDGKGGDVLMRISDSQVSARYVRILLRESSESGPSTKDIRDRLGFAIRELYMGYLDEKDSFKDIIRHGSTNTSQTIMFVSSTDPWHRAVDRKTDTVQPGFDLITRTGLGRGNPVMIPVAILYDTPENMAALVRFLQSRGFPVNQIELGEEPDGQVAVPEHFAALYLQFAAAIHAIDPKLITGGPSLQSEVDGWKTFVDPQGERSWMKRFVAYLKNHKRLGDFGFFSFEWFPFDSLCDPPEEQLVMHPFLMQKAFAGLDQDGVPRNIPWIISEYGYSSFAGRVEVELPAALLNVEIVAQFLMLGGQTAYCYGLEPNVPIRELEDCPSEDRLWGNMMMIQMGPQGEAKWFLPAYYGAKLMIEEWAKPGNELHQLFKAQVRAGDITSDGLTAYAVRRPDSRWGVMILNKSRYSHQLKEVLFKGGNTHQYPSDKQVEVIQYSPKQYDWYADGADGHPTRSDPPVNFRVEDIRATGVVLPPLSLTVVRCNVPENISFSP